MSVASEIGLAQTEPVKSRAIDWTALWSLYLLTLRQQRHGKRWMVMAVLMLLPVGLVGVVRWTAPDVPRIGMEFVFAFMLIPQALLPLVALIYGSGIVQDEVEEQTITYLLMRPITKAQLYLVKLAATWTVAVGLTIVFTALTYIAIYSGSHGEMPDAPKRCAEAAVIHSLAVVAYCAIFGLMSFFTRKALAVGVLYIVIFEGLFANLAFGIRLVTVIYYARLIAYRTIPFVVPTPEGPHNVAADAWQLDVAADPTLSEHPGIRACLLVLVLGSVVCAGLAAFLCSQKEFYVKTPEKA
jgi:ABC-2 type transport system permease protein